MSAHCRAMLSHRILCVSVFLAFVALAMAETTPLPETVCWSILRVFRVFLVPEGIIFSSFLFIDSLGGRLSCCFCFNKKYWKGEQVEPETVGLNEVSINVEDGDVEPLPRSLAGKEALQ